MDDCNYSAFFRRLSGFDPYPYQKQVGRKLIAGKSLLLCAPTGAGKTWAAVAPFLYARLAGKDLSAGITPFDRLIYALPLRTLASSLHSDVVRSTRELGGQTVIQLGKDRDYSRKALYITLQTGDQQDDPLFLGDIIFTTIDQLLASYLNIPFSLPRRLSNINAGALVGAQIVLDEFHLLEEGRSLSTAIEMIDRLKKYATVLVMTATLSYSRCVRLADLLGLEPVELTEAERMSLPAEKSRSREWHFTGSPLTAADLISNPGRTIAICNTVGRAQEIYSRLLEVAPPGVDVRLLHSRFYSDDRSKIEAEVIKRFGKNGAVSDSIILVSTQVIEAGMDISCENMYTEIAPVNALVQRAGRCARYGGRGRVIVCELERPDKTAPYSERMIMSTRAVLPVDPVAIDFLDERAMVDDVHGSPESPETRFMEAFSIGAHRKRVVEAMAGDNPGAAGELIRDIDSVSLVITDEPSCINFGRNSWPQGLSIPRSSLRAAIATMAPYRAWSANLADESDESWLGVDWRPIEDPDEITGVWLVALHPDTASYSSETGLVLGAAGSPAPIRYVDRPPVPIYSYRRETFVEHASRSAGILKRIWPYYTRGSADLCASLAISVGDIQRLARIVVSLHDLGKLSRDWQSFASQWQLRKSAKKLASKDPLAHTDYDPVSDRKLMSEIPRRPPHAAEGAFSISGWLFDDSGFPAGVAMAAISAVARHHSGSTSSVREFSFIDGVEGILGQVAQTETIHLATPKGLLECQRFSEELIDPVRSEDVEFMPLYWYLARILRLCDQLATKEVSGTEAIG